ncbi:MAG TPA: right-handed parallel beta-helix repeat-containing protein, partial [Pyrinomonadaceae bacterium]|nr:right-handed parallel beta-helix repeat-containing protein [Pyrinomonadaceae bacterium]
MMQNRRARKGARRWMIIAAACVAICLAAVSGSIIPRRGKAASTGTSALLTIQGSGAATTTGDFVSSNNPSGISGLNTYYRFFIEVPPGLDRLKIEIFDADVGAGGIGEANSGRDRSRNESFDTSVQYHLIDPNGNAQTTTFSTGNATGPTGADNGWLALYDSTTNTTAGHWELRVDMSSAVTNGDDINAIGIRASDGDPTSGGTELNIYADSYYPIGVNPPPGDFDPSTSRTYSIFPYITSGCSCSKNDFDYDSDSNNGNNNVGSLTFTSRQGFEKTFGSSALSASNAWSRGVINGWNTDSLGLDYGIWTLSAKINSYFLNGFQNGNLATLYMSNDQAAANPPTTNPAANSFRLYLPKDSGDPPDKPFLKEEIIGPANPPGVGQTEEVIIWIQMANPSAYPITFSATNLVTVHVPGGGAVFDGRASASAGTIVSQPSIGGTGDVTWNPGTVPSGGVSYMSYWVKATATSAGQRIPVTGTPASGNGTRAQFIDETGNTNQTRALYHFGPLCELAVTQGLLANQRASNCSFAFSNPPNGTVGTPYSQGEPLNPIITGGSLPPGLTLGGGSISGTPTTAGTYKFDVLGSSTGFLCAGSAELTIIITQTYSIGGQITQGGNALSGVTVTLSGSSSATTTTDGSGNYSFPALNKGGNYTITPSLTNYTFAPTSQTFNNLSADQTQNFTACLNNVTVTNSSDSGQGSLRQALSDVCSGGAINFAIPSNDTNHTGGVNTIKLTSGQLTIAKDVTIKGPNSGANTDPIVVSGNNTSRVLSISSGTVTLDTLTIANGRLSTGSSGAGISNAGSLTILSSTISGNQITGGSSTNTGAGIANLSGTLTMVNSTVSGNTNGGGTLNLGGGLFATGTVTITDSTFSNNTVDGPSVNEGAAILSQGTLTLTGVTIAGNSANSGVGNNGGGLFIDLGTASARNTIISGNTAATNPNLRGSLTSSFNNLIDTPAAQLKLGPLANNSGPTQTMALQAGSIAIEGGTDVTTLSGNGGSINNSQTSFIVTNATAIPSAISFVIQIENEQMIVTGKTGNQLTVTRHANGTTAAAHNDGVGVNPAFDQRGSGFKRKTLAAVDIGAFELAPSAGVSMSDTGVPANDNDGTMNGVDTINSAAAVSAVAFTDEVSNTGNFTDTFNVTATSGSFPGGTSFSFFQGDGVTPLSDTNSDSIPDTGPLAAGASFTVIVKAALPFGTTGGPFNATAKATSTTTGVANAGANGSVTNRVVNVTHTSGVAISDTGIAANDNDGTINGIDTINSGPGQSVFFTDVVTNNGDGNDAFNVSVPSNTFPGGTTFTFYKTDGVTLLTDTTTDTIPDTGSLTAGSSYTVIVKASLPASAIGGPFNATVTATSTASGYFNPGANASMLDRLVSVPQTAAVIISDTGVPANDNDGTINGVDTVNSVQHGGVVSFTDVITNTGTGADAFNVTVPSNTFPAGTIFSIYQSDGVTALTDTNGDNIPDTGSTNAGNDATIVVKAALPQSATGGPFNATVTATSTAAGASNAGANGSMIDRLIAIAPCPSTTVTTTADSGPGSLRDVIANACDQSAITFDTATGNAFDPTSAPHTITLTSGELAISKSLTVTGPAANQLTISGNNASRVFDITAGTVNLNGLTVTGGNSGGIRNGGATLMLANIAVSGNASSGADGGGIFNQFGTLTIVGSTLSNNAGPRGGGIRTDRPLTIINSTISGNSASLSGGGIANLGGGLTLINATVTNNTSDSDDNGVGDGGGVLTDNVNFLLKNSLVAGNFKGTSSPIADDIFATGGGGTDPASSFNLIGIGGAAGLADGLNHNQVGVVDAKLGALANNGGATMTHALLDGSPAIDAGADVTTLTGNGGAIDNAAVTFGLADGSWIPADDNFLIQIDSEQMSVTSKTGNTLTVVRGANGTTAAAHNDGAGVNPAFDQRGSGFPRQVGPIDIGAYELACTTPATPSPTNGGPYCEGQTIQLGTDAVANATYSWTGPGGFTSSDQNPTRPNATNAFAGVYSVAVTFDGCASAAGNTTVVVNSYPSTPTISADINGTGTQDQACPEEPLTLHANSAGAISFQWYSDNTPIGDGTSTLIVTTAGNYSVAATNGTCAARSATYVVQNPTPHTPVISANGPTTLCDGGSVVLQSDSPTGIQWYKDGVAISGANSQNYTANQAGTYTALLNALGCHSQFGNDIVVTVNPLPATPTINEGGPTTFCQGGSVDLSSSSASGNQWYLNGNPIGGAINQVYSATASGNYTVIVTDGNSCASPASIAKTVTVNPLPPTPTITPGGATTFCQGGSVDLSSSSASGNQWYLNGNPIGGATNQVYSATATGNYTVTVTDGNGCSSTSLATAVTVNSIPSTPTITASGPTTFSSAGSVTLNSDSATGNQWYLNGNAIGGATDQAYVASAGGDYTVIVTTSGCSSSPSAATTVTICPTSSTVTNANDSGPGSLRDVIANVCDGATITFDTGAGQAFDPATVPHTITLTSGELAITKGLTINGPGANALTISGNQAGRVFNIGSGTVTISGLTITQGLANASVAPANAGGGIYNAGNLTLDSCVITNNTSDFAGGGIYNNTGGALTITNSTISGNSANGAGGGGGIADFNGSTLNVSNSTISGNSAAGQGGGVLNQNSNATFANTTISGNTAGTDGDGGGLENQASSAGSSVARLTNCTITNNTAKRGSAIVTVDLSNNAVSAETALGNSLIAGNAGPNFFVSGTHTILTDQGNNLDSDGTSALTNGLNGDQIGTIGSPINAMLAPLGNYGGTTQTHALLPGSPALDVGNNTLANKAGLTNDQRGTGFNRIVNTTVDIGAFESNGFSISSTSGTPQSVPINTTFAALVATVTSSFNEPVAGGIVTLSAPNSGASAVFPGNVTSINVTLNADGQVIQTPTANGIAGPYSVVASLPGNSTTANFALTNLKGSQAISVSIHAPANAVYNANFTVAATSTSGLPVTYSSAGSCTNVGPVFTMTSGTVACTVKYDQPGDGNFSAAPQMTESVAAQKATQTIAVNTHAPANAAFNTNFTVAATATSALGVTYSSSGSCTNVGPVFTMTSGGGACTVKYDQAGDGNYSAASQVTESVTAQKATQIITVNTHAPASGAFNTNFTVAATAASALGVTYSSSGSCTNVGPVFTMTSG